MNSDILRGETVRLAALTREDASTISLWYDDTEFNRLFDSVPAYPKTESAVRESITERNKSSDAFVFSIRLIDTNELVGVIDLNGIQWSHGCCWLSVAIGDRANWNKGYGTEAMRLALRYAFNELNLHRVQATVFDYNRRSMAVCEKIGFKKEGSFREFIHRDGKRYDMHLYGILRREWDATCSDTAPA